jgi:hypothetical protein
MSIVNLLSSVIPLSAAVKTGLYAFDSERSRCPVTFMTEQYSFEDDSSAVFTTFTGISRIPEVLFIINLLKTT